jgi:hypothetical protein
MLVGARSRMRRAPSPCVSDRGPLIPVRKHLPSVRNRLGYESGEAQYGDLLDFAAEWLEHIPLELKSD